MCLLTIAERTRLTGLGAVALLLAVAQPASASNSGHLRGPFSLESQQRERANFAAEERSVHRATTLLAPVDSRQSPTTRKGREARRY
jgi:hypothetical protein